MVGKAKLRRALWRRDHAKRKRDRASAHALRLRFWRFTDQQWRAADDRYAFWFWRWIDLSCDALTALGSKK
jgi:hypothetical protein